MHSTFLNINNNRRKTQKEKPQQNRNENRSECNRFNLNYKLYSYPEELCKTRLNFQEKTNNFKSVNNIELENELNNTIVEQKARFNPTYSPQNACKWKGS